MTLTDKIVLITAFVLFWRGWNKGILRTIFGPLALAVCSIIGYSYYLFTTDIITALAISILAPIVLNVIFSIMLNLLSGGKDKERISIPSRILAATLNILWGEFVLIVIVLAISLIPLKFPSLNKAQNDIQASTVYVYLKPKIDEALKTHNVQPIDPTKMAVLSDPKKLEELEKTQEYQSLINDPRIQALLTDPTLSKQIENKQIAEMMKNPKIIELTRNPELLKKFLALYSKMLK